jgi:hypothetical protein
MKHVLVPTLLVLGITMLVGCGESDEYNPDVENAKIRAEEGLDSPKLEPTTEGFAISAPSDPGASYRILKIKKRGNGNLEVLSRRDGPSGTSFARREINCKAYTYRYLGEGDTRADAEKNGSSPSSMSELTGTSASADVANAACRKGVK